MSRMEALVERLHAIYPRGIDLGLDRLHRLLGDLGNPHLALPPVIHVAGTNGKGSTCAFLRAIGEAAGLRVHVHTSPHLVHFNERYRIAGRLASATELEAAFDEIERVNAGQPLTVFEAITAAAFVMFARVPADLCVLEVGLGGRLDATNVIPRCAAAAITSISADHQEFLGDTLAIIAGEKAGIIKPGCPTVTGAQGEEVLGVLRRTAASTGSPLLVRDEAWTIGEAPGGAGGAGIRFTDPAGSLDLPWPALPGAHQLDNAGIALAALGAAGFMPDQAACAAGLRTAQWPARLQRLTGRLAALLPAGSELWLDGAHNEGGAAALARQLDAWPGPTTLLIGMKNTKDPQAFLAPLLPRAAAIFAVAEPEQHLAFPVEAIIEASGGKAVAGPRVEAALGRIATPTRVLICGSLYLAGEVLKLDQAAAPAQAPPTA